MNSKGLTLIELITTVAIVLILASIAVPHYSTVLADSRETVDYNSLLVLDDATNAYAMLNGIPIEEVFDGTSNHKEKILKLVDEKYLMKDVDPAQEDCEFEWDGENCKWTLSNGADASSEESAGGSGSSGDDNTGEGSSGDDSSGEDSSKDEDEDNDNGNNGNGASNGHGHGSGRGWRWRHGHGWQWYGDNGSQGDGSEAYEYFGYGCNYNSGTKVWYNGDYYISHKDTDDIPGCSKNWQKLTDDWHKYNSYHEDDVITYEGKQYRAKKDSCGKDPSSKKSHWECIG